MSVDFQDEIQEDWDMAAVPPKTGTDESATAALKYANLNEALDEAGVAMGDLRANLPIAFRFT
ncbi:MAG: hypothetical protein VCD66_16490 [Alphaproteobacteria bacterium]